MRYRSRLARARVRLRQPTAMLRTIPSFILIGAQRAGTSSLYRYLNAHPQVRRSLRKEVNYFSVDYDRSWGWYRAHFPLRVPACVTFEATPQYFVHPLAPARVHERLPDARLIVTVRDPVDRALSHYRHMRRIGLDHLPLSGAIAAEPSRIEPDLEMLRSNPWHRARDFLRYSYVTRSRYGEQLERWLEFFPRSSIHVLCFDTFRQHPRAEWEEMLDFLGLERWSPTSFENWSTPTRPGIGEDQAATRRIREALGGDPARFADLTGRCFPWT
jgi:hypothetical protein